MYMYCMSCRKIYTVFRISSNNAIINVAISPTTGKVTEELIESGNWERRMCIVDYDHEVQLVMDADSIRHYGIDESSDIDDYNANADRYENLFKPDTCWGHSIALEDLTASDLVFVHRILNIEV